MTRLSLPAAGLLPSLLLAAACDPGSSIMVRQSLRPAPASGCVAAALAASPRVVRVIPTPPTRTESRFWVTFRDSAVRGADVTYRAGREARQDSVPTVEVRFQWTGYLDYRSDAEKQRWMSFGSALLADVEAACAPGSPGGVECTEQGSRGSLWAHTRRIPCPGPAPA